MKKKHIKKPIIDVDTKDLICKETTLTEIVLNKKEVTDFVENFAKDHYFNAMVEYLKAKHKIETASLLIQEISEISNQKDQVIGAKIIIDEVI